MKIFLKIVDGRLLDVFEENVTGEFIEKEFINLDDFYSNIKYEFDEDLDEKIKELLSDTESIKNTLSSYEIKHWVSNRSFGELIDMYENDEIIKPKMQREFVWDSIKCSRLIESIIMGLPIPPLFLLEISKNKYEIIDGFQRLTTVYNFVSGNPWAGKVEGKRNIVSKLSSKISDELQNKTFAQLESEHQRIIRRSTIPLIEFKQLEPENNSSKYVIFERINTGSEKLNPMQIRKSLSYGKFIQDLYISSKQNDKFMSLFSISSIKKDSHAEAYLRVLVMTELIYRGYKNKDTGINGILNEYCDKNKEKEIKQDFKDRFNFSMEFSLEVFKDYKDMFRRVEKDSGGNLQFSGNLNVSILEAFVGSIMYCDRNNLDSIEEVRKKYLHKMNEILEKALENKGDNPFNTSTGKKESIESRFKICEWIIKKENVN